MHGQQLRDVYICTWVVVFQIKHIDVFMYFISLGRMHICRSGKFVVAQFVGALRTIVD